ncbi:fimbrial protein [Chromobacterium haemolyticum]|uniref:Fimbrial protein n=1 Tax=Chromobacterium fluminis TaxID=3044269 RepID=A0ABX0L4S9_9NEIS|nr:fimbrial protein [Chromobacterium haemolyticum]NHR05795.1 fimbrial protein [Chromobacterium haemolyticum]
MGWWGPLWLLLWVSLPAQARITSCEKTDVSTPIEGPGDPISSNSKAGDVVARRTFIITTKYQVATPINNDQLRVGAGWTAAPRPDKFDTIDSQLPGLGVRWRHLDNGLGDIIHSGNNHANTWAPGDDFPKAPGSYSKVNFFVQELVLTDPKLYVGGTVGLVSAGFSIYMYGTGSGTSQNVSKGCNGSSTGVGADIKYPKGVHSFIDNNWSGATPPVLPSPSCKISLNSQQQSVSMDAINVSGLGRKDEVSQDSVSFSIRLEECGINAKPSINFTDAGAPENTSHTLTPNHAGAAGSAKGLGVRLRRGGQADVYFGPPDSADSSRRIALGTASSGNPVLTLDLNAHYVRTTAAPIQPGAFAATATFVVSYP